MPILQAACLLSLIGKLLQLRTQPCNVLIEIAHGLMKNLFQEQSEHEEQEDGRTWMNSLHSVL